MGSFGAAKSFSWGPKWDLPPENFSAFVSLYRGSLILRLPSRTMGGAETALRDFCFGVHLWVALTFLFTTGVNFPLTVSPVLSQAWCWELFQQKPALLPQESADKKGNQRGLVSESCPGTRSGGKIAGGRMSGWPREEKRGHWGWNAGLSFSAAP